MNTNRIAERLSIRYPIFQAPMGRTARPELAAAVTEAGGMGMLGTSWDASCGTLRDSTVRMWENAGCPAAGKRPREGEIVGAFPNGDPIRRYGVPAPMQGATGEIEAFALYAGQSVVLIRDLPPVASVMRELAKAFM